MDPVLDQLHATLPRAQSVEQLTRPLLEILSRVAGMESTYLTTIDLGAGRQHVRFARNAGAMQIPEGVDFPWEDTLCRRSLDEGRAYTPNVTEVWGDSQAASALGIQTYVSTPVRDEEGALMGTLCAASTETRALSDDTEKLLQLFSKLIATWMEREQLVAKLREANQRLASYALVDALTGLPNRRAIVDTLSRALEQAKREGSHVLVGLVDLDGFKRINDTHGHQIGDLFLQEVAQRLRGALRGMDAIGRLGGDEFGLVAPGPIHDAQTAARVLKERVASATAGDFQLKDVQLSYAGASVGVVAIAPAHADAEEAFRQADAEMYRIKRQRRG